MISKEEIEKAKSWLSALDIKSEFEAISKDILLQYIEQLEQKNKTLTHTNKSYKGIINKLNKIIDEMADVICMLDTMNNYDTWNIDIKEVKQYFEKKVEVK